MDIFVKPQKIIFMEKTINALQGKPFSVVLKSMLSSTNYGWCLMSMSDNAVLYGQENIPVSPGVAPVNQVFHFLSTDDSQNPSDIKLQFGLYKLSEECSKPTETIEYAVQIVPRNNITDVLSPQKCGEWSARRDLTEEDEKVFAEATSNLIGVTYTPTKVESQLVNGVNYRFYCNAVVSSENQETFTAVVYIYKSFDPEDKAYVMAIDPEAE